MYRLKVKTADASQQAASSLHTKGRVLAATSPEIACALFGQEFAGFVMDYGKQQTRKWEGDCGASGHAARRCSPGRPAGGPKHHFRHGREGGGLGSMLSM